MSQNVYSNSEFIEAKFHPDPEGVTGTQVFTNIIGALDLVNRLVIMEPGSDLLDPEMGVGIQQYKFNRMPRVIEVLVQKIREQVNRYIDGLQVDITITQDSSQLLLIEITSTTLRQSGVITYRRNTDGVYVLQSLTHF
jgi:hypothetical protein